jgi:NDP-sugar pyrophosphorylase family protein
MKAMVLAAGLGTRLRPLTDDRPKALVEVAGRTMLEITLARLRAFGIRDVIVNVHHFAEMVVEYLAANNNFGMRIEVSREDILLDTGGGLKQAAPFFLDGTASASEPFLLHNVDILSNFDLGKMLAAHSEENALATLAVQKRETSRLLLFDQDSSLRGRQSRGEEVAPHLETLAFAGIHVISPRLLTMMEEQGAFSIITTYLRVAAEGERIYGYRDDGAYWCDLGKPESVAQAASDIEGGQIQWHDA